MFFFIYIPPYTSCCFHTSFQSVNPSAICPPRDTPHSGPPKMAIQEQTLFKFSMPVKWSYFPVERSKRQHVSFTTVRFASLWHICAHVLQVHCFEGLSTHVPSSLKNTFCLLLLQLDVWPSLCRMMCVQSLTSEGSFLINLLSFCVHWINIGIWVLWHCLDASCFQAARFVIQACSLDKCDVEIWSLQGTYTYTLEWGRRCLAPNS